MSERCSEEPKPGMTCKCGTFHKFPAYVYAHYDEKLNFTCPECSARYSILRGNAKLLCSGRKRNQTKERL